MERGHLCEIGNCGRPAIAFGMKRTEKCRSCEQHMASLIGKEMQVYDIEGYFLITSHNDVAMFEERKTLVKQGRGNLTVLETSCESELAEALEAIDVAKGSAMRSLEDRFGEMKAAVNATCAEVKKVFAELRDSFELFLFSQEHQLSPTDQLLCAELNVVPRFLRFGVAEAADRISAVLSDSWVISTADPHSTLQCLHVTQRNTAIESALAEASESAKKGVQQALLYADSLIGDELKYEKEKEQVFAELLVVEKRRIEANLQWLQRSWELRQRYALPESPTVMVGHRLATLLLHQLGQVSTADEILQICYDKAKALNPLSAEFLPLYADMCRLYYDTAQCEQLEELGQWALHTFAEVDHPPEYSWTIMLYLLYSMRRQGRNSEADERLAQWKQISIGDKLAEMLRLLICADEAFFSGTWAEAEKLLEQARHIGTRYLPTSVFTALAFSRLGRVGNENMREQYFRQARSIFEVAAPKSTNSANNLINMGQLLYSAQQLTGAEECYREAQSILEVIAPRSANSANNLSSMGLLLYDTQRFSEAEQCFCQAQSAYEIAAPESVNAAQNLAHEGSLFVAMGRIPEAMDRYQKAADIFAINGKTAEKSETEREVARLLRM